MDIPDDMAAAFLTELGPPEVIRWGRLPVPVIGPTDVLVRVEAVAVNQVDRFVRSGAYRTPVPMPFVVGRDVVGTVAAAGSGAVGFAPGEWVWCNSLGHAGRQGPTAEYAVVPVDRLYRLPAGADPVRAVAALHPAATAYLGLVEHTGLRAGQTVYVGGGGGNVGSAAVAFAAEAGARVIASARPDDAAWCRDTGAEAVFDYRDPGLADRVAAAAPDGVDVWWDTSGYHDLDLTLPLLARRGRLVLTAGMAARPGLPVGPVYTHDVRLVGFAISNAETGELARAAGAVNRLLAADRLPVRVADVLPASAAAEAHRRLADPHQPVRGRLVLRP